MTDEITVRAPHPWLRPSAMAWGALLTVHAALVFVQAMLAGQFMSGNAALRSAHSAIGDDVMPWVALAVLVTAALVWRPGRGPWWPALASLALLVADVTQLALGFAGRVDLHVPLGVAIFGLSVTLLVGAPRLAGRHPTSREPT